MFFGPLRHSSSVLRRRRWHDPPRKRIETFSGELKCTGEGLKVQTSSPVYTKSLCVPTIDSTFMKKNHNVDITFMSAYITQLVHLPMFYFFANKTQLQRRALFFSPLLLQQSVQLISLWVLLIWFSMRSILGADFRGISYGLCSLCSTWLWLLLISILNVIVSSIFILM